MMPSALETSGPYPVPSRGVTRRVWEIADEISARRSAEATREEVVTRFAQEGGNPETAKTQYSKWLKNFREALSARPAGAKLGEPDSVEPCVLQVAPDGRLLIPQKMREAMMLDPDGRVTALVEDGELRIVAPRAGILRLQKMARRYKKPGESVVDELIAERRAEAMREDADN